MSYACREYGVHDEAIRLIYSYSLFLYSSFFKELIVDI